MTLSVVPKVRAALRTRLLTALPVPARQMIWEGEASTPDLRAAWVEEKLLPQTSRVASLGQFGLLRTTGILLLDCHAPPKQGTVEAEALADALMALFPPNTVLQYAGQSVTIRTCYQSQGLTSAEHFFIPVTVEWYADITNTI